MQAIDPVDHARAERLLARCRAAGIRVALLDGKIYAGIPDPDRIEHGVFGWRAPPAKYRTEIEHCMDAIAAILGNGSARPWGVEQIAGGCLLYHHAKFFTRPTSASCASPAEKTDRAGGLVMPLGKYRGHPLSTVARDSRYCAWLLDQPWFRAKFPAHAEYLRVDGCVDRDEGPSAA